MSISARLHFSTAALILRAFRDAQTVTAASLLLEASVGIGYGRVLRLAPDWIAGDELNRAAKLGEGLAGRNEILLTRAAWSALGGDWRADRGLAKLGGLKMRYYPSRPSRDAWPFGLFAPDGDRRLQ